MNKVLGWLKGLVGLAALVVFALALAWLLETTGEGIEMGQWVSPIETLTPLPGGLAIAPMPGGTRPWSKPKPDPTELGKRAAMATANAIATLMPPRTPAPTGETKMYPIHSLDDVIAIALEDPFVQSRLESECRKGAAPGAPLFVKYIGEDTNGDWGYYLVPFHKDNYIVLTAIVGTMENQGAATGSVAECSCSPEAIAARAAEPKETPQESLHIGIAEAKQLVEEKGYRVEEEPRLVWRGLEEGADEFDPFWEFKTVNGEILYVIHKARDIRLYRATDVHSNR